jgi:hypothetical protein
MPILSNFTLHRELLGPPDSLERHDMKRTEPYKKKRARQISDAESMAKQLRKALQGRSGDAISPETLQEMLLNLGFQPTSKCFLNESVQVNIDSVHGHRRGERHLDVEGLQDRSRAKVHYFA